MTTPDQIRRDIERTRRELSSDVDLLAEKITPSRVVERRVERARDTITNVKEKVMGTAGEVAHAAQDHVSDAVGSVRQGPVAVRRQARGNPLAAGLVAFGAGWLVASMMPATEAERRAAEALKEKASDGAQMLKAPLGEAAHDVAEALREPAAEAADSVRAAAGEAVATVKEEASGRA
jgi:ElaB/YqjD/DUF883 family membrane-anchored ribosome-binding protein